MPKDKAHCDIDPVCKMDLSGKEGKVGYDFEDETYYSVPNSARTTLRRSRKNTPSRPSEKKRTTQRVALTHLMRL